MPSNKQTAILLISSNFRWKCFNSLDYFSRSHFHLKPFECGKYTIHISSNCCERHAKNSRQSLLSACHTSTVNYLWNWKKLGVVFSFVHRHKKINKMFIYSYMFWLFVCANALEHIYAVFLCIYWQFLAHISAISFEHLWYFTSIFSTLLNITK